MGALCDAIRTGTEADVAELLAADPEAAGEFDESGISGLMLALYLGKSESAAEIAAHLERGR